jgi:hypothetical protein
VIDCEKVHPCCFGSGPIVWKDPISIKNSF